MRAAFIWCALAFLTLGPVALAATSPLLAWRDPIYIAAGFAGVIAMALLLVQPLLILGLVPNFPGPRGRKLHRAIGGALVLAIVLHVGGLWLTSPPDVIDALLLRSPTPFSIWGVLAMCAVLISAALAIMRRRVRPRIWRRVHVALAVVIVTGTILHALLIDGTMEQVSKLALSVALAASLSWLIVRRFRTT